MAVAAADTAVSIVTIRIRRETLDQLRTEARRRGVKHHDLAAEILGAVMSHDLIVAVLGN
jgi:hypothetical protein